MSGSCPHTCSLVLGLLCLNPPCLMSLFTFFPFAGGLVNGRYSRDMFSPEECRQRHADIISRLIAVFGLQGSSNGF